MAIIVKKCKISQNLRYIEYLDNCYCTIYTAKKKMKTKKIRIFYKRLGKILTQEILF